MQHMGHGSGGLSLRYHYQIQHEFELPIKRTVLSDMFESEFQFLLTISRSHAFLEALRRTFVSRLPNPISRTFIGYAMEPPGAVTFHSFYVSVIRELTPK